MLKREQHVFVEIGAKTPEIHDKQKSTLFDKLIPIFVQTTNVSEE